MDQIKLQITVSPNCCHFARVVRVVRVKIASRFGHWVAEAPDVDLRRTARCCHKAPSWGGFGLWLGSPVWFWRKLGRRRKKLRRKQRPTGGGVPGHTMAAKLESCSESTLNVGRPESCFGQGSATFTVSHMTPGDLDPEWSHLNYNGSGAVHGGISLVCMPGGRHEKLN